MPCILNIETATEVCSVVVSKDGQIIYQKEETEGPSHAVLLAVFVNEAVREVKALNLILDAVAVSCGPGSYTGLRIGVSEAKGLCYGLDIPMIAINSLRIMANGVVQNDMAGNDALLCPMIDARRMEVYDVLLDSKLCEVLPVSADIIDENSFGDYLKENKIIFFGNGSMKCKGLLNSENALFLDNIYPRALDMVSLSEIAYAENDFVDTAYFEPFYLKEFVATTPKDKVLSAIKK